MCPHQTLGGWWLVVGGVHGGGTLTLVLYFPPLSVHPLSWWSRCLHHPLLQSTRTAIRTYTAHHARDHTHYLRYIVLVLVHHLYRITPLRLDYFRGNSYNISRWILRHPMEVRGDEGRGIRVEATPNVPHQAYSFLDTSLRGFPT